MPFFLSLYSIILSKLRVIPWREENVLYVLIHLQAQICRTTDGGENKRRRHLVCEIIRGNVIPERSKRIAIYSSPPRSLSSLFRFAARIVIPLSEQNLARDRWMVAHLMDVARTFSGCMRQSCVDPRARLRVTDVMHKGIVYVSPRTFVTIKFHARKLHISILTSPRPVQTFITLLICEITDRPDEPRASRLGNYVTGC